MKDARLPIDEPIETFSTPRRLTVRSGRSGERQTDLEELVTGPPVSAAFGADGKLTPAGAGFAKKQGVPEDQIERIKTPRANTSACASISAASAAVDVLPEVLTGVLRGLSFPKQMRWDALLDDGKGELPFGRPIRWILYLVRRARRAVHHRALAARAGPARAGHQRRRGDLRAPLPDHQRPRRAARSR